MRRRPVLQAGLVLLLFTMLMFGLLASPFPGIYGLFAWAGGLALVGFALVGLAGFALMIASTFLPADKGEEPTFTEDLTGREKTSLGGVYTGGDWETVLSEKDRKEKEAGTT